jgi:hypothetical protein
VAGARYALRASRPTEELSDLQIVMIRDKPSRELAATIRV